MGSDEANIVAMETEVAKMLERNKSTKPAATRASSNTSSDYSWLIQGDGTQRGQHSGHGDRGGKDVGTQQEH